MKAVYPICFCFLLFIIPSCSLIKPMVKYDFAPIESYKDINGIYENIDNRIIDAFSYSGNYNHKKWSDSIRYYKMEMQSDQLLRIYGLTDEGFQYITEFKGKYRPEKHYFQVTINKKFIPAVIFTVIGSVKINIGKNWKNDLFFNGQEKGFGYFIGLAIVNDAFAGAAGVPPGKDILIPYKDESGLFGYKDEKGKIVIVPEYDSVTLFDRKETNSAYAKVKKANQWGVIDRKGETVILVENDSIEINQGYFIISRDGKSETVDQPETVIPQ